jgi:hypothetical protein
MPSMRETGNLIRLTLSGRSLIICDDESLKELVREIVLGMLPQLLKDMSSRDHAVDGSARPQSQIRDREINIRSKRIPGNGLDSSAIPPIPNERSYMTLRDFAKPRRILGSAIKA